MSSTGELIEISEANTSINLMKGNIMSIFNEASTQLITPYGRSIAQINYIINRTHIAIEPHFFQHIIPTWILEQYPIFALLQEEVVDHNDMVRVRTIRIQYNNLQEVIIGGQSTNRVYRGKKMAYGSGSELQQAIFFEKGLLSMSMGGILHVYHNHMEIYY